MNWQTVKLHNNSNSLLVQEATKHWKSQPEKIFFETFHQSFSGKDLLANFINYRKNIVKIFDNEEVLLVADNSAEWVLSYLAIKSLGKTPLILNSEILEQFTNLKKNKNISLITEKKIKNIKSILYSDLEVKNSNILDIRKNFSKSNADIVFTSGTSGEPKGVVVPEQSYLHTTKVLIDIFKQSKKHSELLSMPFSHSFGLARLRCSLFSGSSAVITNGLRNTPKIYSFILNGKINSLSMVPSALKVFKGTLRKSVRNIAGKIKYIEIGSSFLDEDLNNWLLNNFKSTIIYHHYGMTEASRSFFRCRSVLGATDRKENNWVGYPALGTKYKMEKLSKDDNLGEILIKGKNLAQSYYLNEKLTKKKFQSGWFKTGDIGYEKNGLLYLSGRVDGRINIGGNKIFPNEIESIVQKIKGVIDCYVYPIKDEIYGTRLAIAIKNSKNANENSIRKEIKIMFHDMPDYKKLKRISFSNKIPYSKNGKKIRNQKTYFEN